MEQFLVAEDAAYFLAICWEGCPEHVIAYVCKYVSSSRLFILLGTMHILLLSARYCWTLTLYTVILGLLVIHYALLDDVWSFKALNFCHRLLLSVRCYWTSNCLLGIQGRWWNEPAKYMKILVGRRGSACYFFVTFSGFDSTFPSTGCDMCDFPSLALWAWTYLPRWAGSTLWRKATKSLSCKQWWGIRCGPQKSSV